MQLNASRIKFLQAQDDIVNAMKETASKELLRVSDDQNAYTYKKLLQAFSDDKNAYNYKKLLQALIVQVLLHSLLLKSYDCVKLTNKMDWELR